MPRDAYYMPQRGLTTQDDAARIEAARVPRSKFTNTWSRDGTWNAGLIYPILVEPMMPGDHFAIDCSPMLRMNTPIFPLFDDQRVDIHYFFCPNRLVWDNWVRLMGEQSDPGDSIAYTIPQLTLTASGDAVGSLVDHMGIPVLGQVGAGLALVVNALPFRMYNLIWNEWYRDENLQPPVTVTKGNTGDLIAHFTLLERNKSHDYFTSALPWPQKFTAPTVPFSGLAPVIGIGTELATHQTGPANFKETGGLTTSYADWVDTFDAVTGKAAINWDAATGFPKVYANLAAATGVAINTFRQAFLVQQLLERDARGGTRYPELIRSHWGVINPDFRLQRPEYVGGGRANLNITPIAQTAPGASTPVGALGATGTAIGSSRATYAATEHGYLIGLMSIRSNLRYQQGLHRKWTVQTRYDFPWPSLMGLGEQAILRQELYAKGDPSLDTLVFGYQERWHEYRTHYNDVVGIMRSQAANTIDPWHLGQAFGSPPTLGASFLRDSPPMDRILAAGSVASTRGMQYLGQLFYSANMVRPITAYGTPVLLGRF